MVYMYHIYILKSKIKDRYYVGYTNNLSEGLKKHNNGSNVSTRPHKPWEIIYSESFGDKRSAWLREQQIKSYKGGEAFRELIQK